MKFDINEIMSAFLTDEEAVGAAKYDCITMLVEGFDQEAYEALKRVISIMEANEESHVQANMVDHPEHYRSSSGIECYEVIKDVIGEQWEGFCIGNIIKYVWRMNKKNGLEDAYKAKKYFNLLGICD